MTRLRLLWMACAGSVGFLGVAYGAYARSQLALMHEVFREEFLPNVEAATIVFTRWAKQQPGEYGRWTTFKNEILAGQNPTPPTMTTRVGKYLVAAGKMSLLATGTPPPVPHVLFPGPSLYPSERVP